MAATDDENDTVTYSLGGTDAASFDFDTATGQIKTKDALDFEGGTTTYSVTVSVTDSKDDVGNAENPAQEDATIEVTIKVTEVNEGPTFADRRPRHAGSRREHRGRLEHRHPLHGHRPRGRHAV